MSEANEDKDTGDFAIYNPLKHIRKRPQYVTLSSSSSSSDDESDLNSQTPPKSRRQSWKRSKTEEVHVVDDTTSSATSNDQNPGTVVLDEEGDSVFTADNIYTEEEREEERRRLEREEREIQKTLSQDKLLNQTKSIIDKYKTTQTVVAGDESSDSDGFEVVDAPAEETLAAPKVEKEPVVSVARLGERLTISVRANGDDSKKDELDIYKKQTFDMLYQSYCELHGLPRSAVLMSFDGVPLNMNSTPEDEDMEAGDLVEAKANFSLASSKSKKTFVRLKVVVKGRRPEYFKIDEKLPMEKLRAAFCKKHSIDRVDKVELELLGDPMEMSRSIASYKFEPEDEINVKLADGVEITERPRTLEGKAKKEEGMVSITLRFPDGKKEQHYIRREWKVDVLMEKVANARGVPAYKVELSLDTEFLSSVDSFEEYELAEGEVLSVKILP